MPVSDDQLSFSIAMLGRRERLKGNPISDNPYDPTTEEANYESWNKGYNVAEFTTIVTTPFSPGGEKVGSGIFSDHTGE